MYYFDVSQLLFRIIYFEIICASFELKNCNDFYAIIIRIKLIQKVIAHENINIAWH